MSTSRISGRELERLGDELTERDRAIVEMVERLHLVTGNQLLRVHWPQASEADARAARRTMKRLVDWRVLARLERRLGGLGRGSDSWTYALDVAGHRLLRLDGTARRPHLPGPPMWRHALLVSEVYARTCEALRGTERSLAEWQGEPATWRDFTGAYGERQRLKPDGFVRITEPGYEDLFFIEADTGSQSRTVIRAKLDAYRRYAATGHAQDMHGGTFPQIVFVTTTPARQAAIVDLLGELPAEVWPMFAVGIVTDTARLLGAPGGDA